MPLVHADGHIGGWIWPDDPVDCLLPTPDRLRILRTFANQALAAVSDAAHVDQLEALARLDGLTGVLNHRAFFEHLDRSLQALPEGEREAITLAYFGGQTYREVADLLDQPEGTVKSRIRSGLKRLRTELVGAGIGGDL